MKTRWTRTRRPTFRLTPLSPNLLRPTPFILTSSSLALPVPLLSKRDTSHDMTVDDGYDHTRTHKILTTERCLIWMVMIS